MGGKVFEITIVIGALSVLEALELNLSGVFLFSDVYFFAGVGNIARIDRIKDVELQSPNDISGVFDVA